MHSMSCTRPVMESLIGHLLPHDLAPAAMLTLLKDTRLRYVARRLHHQCAVQPNSEASRACLELMSTLSDEALSRILQSPELCGLLRLGGTNESISAMFRSEAVLDNKDHTYYIDRWSSLGNVWLGDSLPSVANALAFRDNRFWGPELKCGIPIDLSLPLNILRPSAGLVNPRFLEQAEVGIAVGRLDDTLDLVRRTYAFGYEVVKTLVSNVVLRIEDSRPGECWGATSGAVIGRMVVVNPLAESVGVFGEVVLHEAMHVALDCAELTNPLIDETASASTMVTSPWTGNALTLHAFVHASAVWAVLLDFWEQVSLLNEHEEEVGKRHKQIKGGFHVIPVDRILGENGSRLSEAGTKLLSTAWEFGAGR